MNPIYCVFSAVEQGVIGVLGAREAHARVNRYRVDAVKPVTGALPATPDTGWRMARAEGDALVSSPSAITYCGVTQHFQYTTETQAGPLASRAEFPADGDDIRAVLIPIRKTDAWWSLPHDLRLAHFKQREDGHGHANLGVPYVGQIFRRLYHSRYLGRKPGFDFLTYFEFPRSEEHGFRELLEKLRDTKLNPEWQYVDLEFEIWMTKLV